jgi:hypothetical protein
MTKLINFHNLMEMARFNTGDESGKITQQPISGCKVFTEASESRASDNFRERISDFIYASSSKIYAIATNERGDVPGWVLVVLMTTGLVTGIWTMAAPRIQQILRSSLDSMNGIR